MKIAAIVLAAGKSERMGRPKALLRFGEDTFLSHIIGTIGGSPAVERTIVVLGHDREIIEQAVAIPNVVFNPDYECGMVTSFQAGIRALSVSIDAAFLFLVDHPVVDQKTIGLLAESFKPGSIVLPIYQGRRGHPVLFSKAALAEIAALPPSSGPNVVVRRQPERIIEVPVDAPGILIDVDTPAEFEKYRGSFS